jgi:hypothetical protein
MKGKSGANTPKDCATCSDWKKVRKKIRTSKLLEKAIEAFEERIQKEEFKPTIAEYLKLVQLEQESDQDNTKEIKVTWVDPTVKSKTEE